MHYLINKIVQHGTSVKEFYLTPVDGSDVPMWNPGASVVVSFRSKAASEFHNTYSLIGTPGSHLRIAVQREESGRGGSRVLHEEFKVGMEVELGMPIDTFKLHAGNSRNVLIAGGIGITPLISMVRALDNGEISYELHYLTRDASRLVLMDQFEGLSYGNIYTYMTSNGRPNLEALIGQYFNGSELHACGPLSLLDEIRKTATQIGWPLNHLHFESFGAKNTTKDKPLTVYLRQSDVSLNVDPGTSILDAMIAADVFVSYDCKRGECGNCYTTVLSGEPLHRDVCLTSKQRSQGMTTCVSWANGSRIELDI